MINNLAAGGFASIEQAAGRIQRSNHSGKDGNSSGVSFQEIFNQKRSIAEAAEDVRTVSKLKFSKHADQRLKQRDITLTQEQLFRLSDGVQKAEQKGIKDSLVLLDNMAFIVNVKSNTVVTTMDQNLNEENVFTNIDGAVII